MNPKSNKMKPEKQSALINRFGNYSLILIVILACSIFKTPTEPEEVKQPTQEISSEESVPSTTVTEMPIEVFSIDNANTIPPDDVISEVYYDTSGGPDGYAGDCYDTGPEYPVAAPYNQKVVERHEELLTPVRLIVCGWEDQEKIEMRFITPDGKVTETTLIAQIDASSFYSSGIRTEYIYFPPINSLEGKYEFIFTGKSGVVKHIIHYTLPSSPMAYIINTEKLSFTFTNIHLSLTNNLPIMILSGYLPSEKVRLFLYNGGAFNAWTDFQVNQAGRLSIQPQNLGSVLTYVVIGGTPAVEIHPPYYPEVFIQYVDRLDPIYLTCKDTIPTRLKIGDYASISENPPLSNRLRSEPRTSANLIDNLAPGTVMKIVDGPECADGTLWWKVVGVNGDFEGWTGEGDTAYWLIPCYSKDYC